MKTDQISCAVTLLPKSEISSLLAPFSGYTDKFVQNLVGKLEDRFTRNAAHFAKGNRLNSHYTNLGKFILLNMYLPRIKFESEQVSFCLVWP